MFSYLSGGNAKGYCLCGKYFGSSYEVTYTLITWSGNATPRYFLKGNENLRSQENMYTNIYKDFICNNQNPERTQMPLNGKME